jgi:hypothetical protein
MRYVTDINCMCVMSVIHVICYLISVKQLKNYELQLTGRFVDNFIASR